MNEDELGFVQVNVLKATIDREIASFLNIFRE
jgi:hypothetical protein